jgi:DNA polymerase
LSNDRTQSVRRILQDVRGSLTQYARWGMRGAACAPESLATLERWCGPPAAERTQETLEKIRADLGDCRRCGLSGGRTHIVFGEGHPKARLIFVGEGPGFEEDRSGRPFVGPAGELLERIIQAMKLSREQVYICNVVKCRPPDNRNPRPEEIAACRPFLDRQLKAIGAVAICALGNVAAQTLLGNTTPITRLRGRFHEFRGLQVMPTFHPAYLLRNPDDKRAVWEDMKKIMALLGIPL